MTYDLDELEGQGAFARLFVLGISELFCNVS
jgi:hypothetical protein